MPVIGVCIRSQMGHTHNTKTQRTSACLGLSSKYADSAAATAVTATTSIITSVVDVNSHRLPGRRLALQNSALTRLLVVSGDPFFA